MHAWCSYNAVQLEVKLCNEPSKCIASLRLQRLHLLYPYMETDEDDTIGTVNDIVFLSLHIAGVQFTLHPLVLITTSSPTKPVVVTELTTFTMHREAALSSTRVPIY